MPSRFAPVMASVLVPVIVPALLASACRDAAAPEPPARDASPVQTDAVVYHLRRSGGAYEATAVATYVNRTGAPVYYARCGVGGYDGPIFGYRRTGPDRARTLFTDSAWGCVGGVPTGELRPGDSVVVRVRLGALDQRKMTPPLTPEAVVGRMRVVLQLCSRFARDSDDCALLPQFARQSNAFDVRY